MGGSVKAPRQQVSKAEVSKAMGPRVWDLGDGVLYQLCAKHPQHLDEPEIVAKVWLIGRSYAASIERFKKADDRRFFTEILAPHIKNSKLDVWLGALPGRPAPFLRHQRIVLLTHGLLVRSLSDVLSKNARSFASKYLHFHRPDLFPIYDSRAASAIKKLTPDPRFVHVERPKGCDQSYAEFAARIAYIVKDVRMRHQKNLSLRQVDRLLLEVFENEHR